MQTQSRQLHIYVLGLVGIWCLFVFTLPVAYLRVSRSQTFTGTPFRSFTLEDQLFGPPAD